MVSVGESTQLRKFLYRKYTTSPSKFPKIISSRSELDLPICVQDFEVRCLFAVDVCRFDRRYIFWIWGISLPSATFTRFILLNYG